MTLREPPSKSPTPNQRPIPNIRKIFITLVNIPLSPIARYSQLIQCVLYTFANTLYLSLTSTSTPRSPDDVFTDPFGCKYVSTLFACLHVGILSWVFGPFVLDLFHLLPWLGICQFKCLLKSGVVDKFLSNAFEKSVEGLSYSQLEILRCQLRHKPEFHRGITLSAEKSFSMSSKEV